METLSEALIALALVIGTPIALAWFSWAFPDLFPEPEHFDDDELQW